MYTSTTPNDNMALQIHYKYAVKCKNMYVAINDEGRYYLSSESAKAESRWDVRGAKGIWESYLKETWNQTMGDKPECEIVMVHRPQRIHHWW